MHFLPSIFKIAIAWAIILQEHREDTLCSKFCHRTKRSIVIKGEHEMKKTSILKRILSSGLALALFVSSPVSVYAVEDEAVNAPLETVFVNTSGEASVASVGESEENNGSAASGETDSESGTASSTDASQTGSENSISESNSTEEEKINTDDARAGASIGQSITSDEDEELEDDEEEEEELEAKTYEATVNGFTITAEVPAGAFNSADVKFIAEAYELSADERDAVDQLVTEGYEDKEVLKYDSFDLHFVVDGIETEPNEGSEIKVSITSNNFENPEIVHFDDETGNAEVVTATATDAGVVFAAEQFSIYTVASTSTWEFGKIVWKWNKTNYWTETHTAVVVPIDENGNRITTSVTMDNITINDDGNGGNLSGESYGTDKDYFESLAPEIEGYTYKGVYNKKISDTSSWQIWNISFNSSGSNTDNYWHCVQANSNQWTSLFENNNTEDNTTIYMVYTKSSVRDEITYFSGNLFNYSQYYVNAASVKSNMSNGTTKTLLFHDGGSLHDDYSKYGALYFNNTEWNLCDTVGNTNGVATSFQGIMQSSLVNNLPVSNYRVADIFDSNSSLFTNATDSDSSITTDDTKAYTQVQIPFFTDEDGYYVLDSSDSYDGYYNTYRYDASSNSLVMGTQTGSKEGFWPFGTDDYHFGMAVSVNFNINEDGLIDDDTKDMIFEFAGDDDVWVFIDGKLALDMGGVHQTVKGSINFNDGDCTVINALTSSGSRTSVTSNLYTDVLGYTSESIGKSALATGDHTLTVFYLERGAGASNCKIKFNFKPNKTTTVDYKGIKVDSSGNPIAGATFKLYTNPECTEEAHIDNSTSDAYGTISFAGLTTGDSASSQKCYYMKETVASTSYSDREFALPATAIWVITVTRNEDETLSTKLTPYNDAAKQLSLNSQKQAYSDDDTEVTYIKNLTTDEVNILEVDKKVSVVDYDKRVYRLDLEADYNGTEVVEVETEVSTDADVVLVIDNSGSMIYTDAAIITANSSDDAYDLLSSLDTSKIYFTSSASDYYKHSVYSSVESYLLAGAASNGYYYGIPIQGNYLFYANGSWYSRSLNYKSNNNNSNLSNKNWNSTRNATQITTENCPTTIYTNRSEVIQNAAKSFVDGLSDGSNVAVVTFNFSAVNRCGFTNIGTDKSTIDTALDNTYGVYYTGTYPEYGLTNANNLLASDPSTDNKNYVVFFTDGANDGDDISKISSSIKEKATVYAVGAGENGDTLKTVATDENHLISASTVSELASSISGIAKTITNETKVKTGKGTVTDYIDIRFVACDEDGNLLSNGASVGANGEGKLVIAEDGSQSVVWTDVNIGTGDNKWSDYIYVKAKDTFFGGNKVVTNGPGSNVSITGDKTKYFPQPTVNVKLLDFTPANNEITLWLGDTITATEYVKWLKENTNIPEDALNQIAFTEDELSSLISGTTVNKDYIAGGETLGKFSFTATAKDNENNVLSVFDHVAEITGQPAEIYTLTISYVPVAVSARDLSGTERIIKAPKGIEVTTVTNESSYKVNVVTGAIDITKHATDESGATLAGAQYLLEKNIEDKWTRFNAGQSGTDGIISFASVGVGQYRITEEVAPEGYALSSDTYLVNIVRDTASEDVKYNISVTKNDVVVASWTVDAEIAASQATDTTLYKCEFVDSVVRTGFNVVDQMAYSLPETGGSGIFVYTIGGVLLMLVAALLLYKSKNKKDK